MGKQTWIFQGNPDRFDIDSYLAAGHPRITWRVTHHRKTITPGDEVYLWRAAGGRKAVAGVIARAIVDSTPWEGVDHPEARAYWHDGEGRDESVRVWLRIDRVANSREVIKRGWLLEDPVCKDLLVLKQPHATNYRVPPHHVHRIQRLWDRVGKDWTIDESVAALWACDRIGQGGLSRGSGSLIALVAGAIGRPTKGVYDKVLDFRSLDPADPQAGLSGASAADREVWHVYYDKSQARLNSELLELAFHATWNVPISDQPLVPASPDGDARPDRVQSIVTRVVRDTRVSEWVKTLYDYACQVCGARLTVADAPYAEGAHIHPLGREHGGPDIPGNILCLCPNHHVLFDRGGFAIGAGYALLDVGGCDVSGTLSVHSEHTIDRACLAYRNEVIAVGRGITMPD